MKKIAPLLLLVTLALMPQAAPSQGVSVNGLQLERNVFVPMRDGIRLATDIYRPAQAGGNLPVILIRTPYGKDRGFVSFDRRLSLIRFFTDNGYAVVIQDKRGRFRSEGRYVVSGGDGEDGYDTVDWLSRQSWSNGRVGMIGCSYEGDVQLFAAGTRHPALRAIIPQASGSSVGGLAGQYRYFGIRVGGAVDWATAIGWFSQNGQKYAPRLPADLSQHDYNSLSDQWDVTLRERSYDYRTAWYHLPMRDALAALGVTHTDFEDNVTRGATDPYWLALPYMTDSYTSDVPALFVNSWYDFGAAMTLLEFNHLRRQSASPLARQNQYVIMSPHTHCMFESGAAEQTMVGERDLGDTRLDYRALYLTWFDAWLKNDQRARRQIETWAPLRYFAMGRNRWQAARAWPIPLTEQRSLFLSSTAGANSLFGDGRLLTAPSSSSRRADTFVYDPANPVPSRGGAMCCSGAADATPGAMDQRVIEARNDVLIYDGDTLEQELEVTGDVRLVLYVSSTAIDSDFTAKLVDVYPDGRAFNVLEGILRARYREGQQREVWMERAGVYEIEIPLGATSNVFGVGHRIRLEVSSSNFPRFDRNLNLGGDNMSQVRWVVAQNSVHHGPLHRSRLILPVIAR